MIEKNQKLMLKQLCKYEKRKKEKNALLKNIYIENQIFKVIIKSPESNPGYYRDVLIKVNNINYETIIKILRFMKLNNVEARLNALNQIDKLIELINRIIKEDITALEEYENYIALHSNDDKRYSQAIYKMTLLKYFDDEKNTLFKDKKVILDYIKGYDCNYIIKDVFYNIAGNLGKVKQNFMKEIIQDARSEIYNINPQTIIDKDARIEELEFNINSLCSTLSYIENSLDNINANIEEKVAESEKQVISNFFIQFNSSKFGNMLDKIIVVEKQIDTLKKSGFKIPKEFSSIPIIIKNFAKFIKEFGIEPIEQAGKIFEAIFEDIEYMTYNGEPFLNNETKKLEIDSPGWKYQDIIISKPSVKEILE